MIKDPTLVLLGRIAWCAIVAGVLVTAGALVWWTNFYGAVVGQDASASLRNALPCIYSRSGVCGFIPGIARSSGRLAYTPTAFWFGTCLLLSGVAMRLLIARRKP